MAPGNSGGPAIDRQGRVIGLATFGTGYFRRIGGIVSHNSYIPVAARARLRNAERERTLYVTGMEYVQLPKSREHVQLPPSWEVENFNGALRYRIFKRHAWPSDDQSYYIDSTGLYYLGGTVYYKTPWDSFEATFRWQRKPPQPILLFRFPPVAGDSWEVEDHWTPGGGLLARPLGSEELRPIAVKGRVKVDSVNEVVTVPAGTFDKCIKITQDLELATMRAGRGERARLIKTTWYAGTVGAVRVVGRLAGTGGWTREWTRELTGDTLLPE
ncbi:MAG: serine protease [Armatimonadetes bacterium]|nr:serine protease [Armatimonadota bacterium]